MSKKLKIIFFIFSLIFSILISTKYNANIFIYLIFSLVSHSTLFYCLLRNSLFFEQFIAILIWLGFWFKLSLGFLLDERPFEFEALTLNKALLVSTISLLALCLAKYIRDKFFPINLKLKRAHLTELNLFKVIYVKNRNKILIVYGLLFIILCSLNFIFGIYQRGMQANTTLPFHLNSLVEFMFIFGLGLFSSHILFFETFIKKQNSFLVFVLVGIENLCSSISILSRGMVFNLSSLAYGLFLQKKNKKILPWFVLIFLIVFLFIISLKITSEIRSAKYINEPVLTNRGHNITDSPVYLVYNRWVGIEELIMVINKKDLNFNLWLNSLKESASKKEPSFFDKNFTKDRYANIDWSKNNFITTPGVIAFFFYPGSYVFLFSCLTLIFFFTSLIELAAFHFGRKNLIFCSFVGQTLAFRLVHFGFAPLNSYKLYSSIFISILLIGFTYNVISGRR